MDAQMNLHKEIHSCVPQDISSFRAAAQKGDRPTKRPTDHHSGLQSRVARDLKKEGRKRENERFSSSTYSTQTRFSRLFALKSLDKRKCSSKLEIRDQLEQKSTRERKNENELIPHEIGGVFSLLLYTVAFEQNRPFLLFCNLVNEMKLFWLKFDVWDKKKFILCQYAFSVVRLEAMIIKHLSHNF